MILTICQIDVCWTLKRCENVPEENGKKSGTILGVCEYLEFLQNDEKIPKVQ
jgi:hypothetical protein